MAAWATPLFSAIGGIVGGVAGGPAGASIGAGAGAGLGGLVDYAETEEELSIQQRKQSELQAANARAAKRNELMSEFYPAESPGGSAESFKAAQVADELDRRGRFRFSREPESERKDWRTT